MSPTGYRAKGTNGDIMNRENETIDELRNRLRRKWGDYPLTILIINPINLRLVRIIGRTDITPNQLTVVSFMLMVLASFCLASVSRAVQAMGGVLVLIAFVIDCLDGDLARFKGITSPLGAMLDPILDRLGEFAVIIGIAVNGWRTTQDPIWLIGGIFLMGISQIYFYLVDAMVWKLPEKETLAAPRRPLTIGGTRVRFGAIEPFVWGQTLLVVCGVARWGVPIFSLMFTVGTLKVMVRLFRRANRLNSEKPEDFGIHTR